MRENKHVGIYGGSFDPIHFGHINLALSIMEAHQLDEVWFCPAGQNPHKTVHPTTKEHRLAMLELSVQDIPSFGIIANELKRDGPSFTVDTLKELVEEENQSLYPSKFFLILGEDSLPGFFQWKDPLEIIQLATPLVGKRYKEELHLQGDLQIISALERGMTKTPLLEISATEIRNRVENGLYIGHLTPSKVVDYIYQNQLYSF